MELRRKVICTENPILCRSVAFLISGSSIVFQGHHAREFLNAHQQAMLKDLHLTCAPGKSVLSVLQIKQELEVR